LRFKYVVLTAFHLLKTEQAQELQDGSNQEEQEAKPLLNLFRP
jgi:hypothetical protein